jgi:hypothetical protein
MEVVARNALTPSHVGGGVDAGTGVAAESDEPR